MNGTFASVLADARAALMASVFASRADEILNEARPLIRLDSAEASADPRAQMPASWLGGEPVLPADIEWPSWNPTQVLDLSIASLERKIAEYKPFETAVNGKRILPDSRSYLQKRIDRLRECRKICPRPLSFLCQIDLGEAGLTVEAVGLPSQGTLWFFNDAEFSYQDEPTSWRVIYRPENLKTMERRHSPESIRSFKFTPVVPTAGFVINDPMYADVSRNLIGILERVGGSFSNSHTLGDGTSDPAWCGPRVQRHRTTLPLSTPVTKEQWAAIEHEATDLKQLLNLASRLDNSGPGWIWGDMGNLTFWLGEADWKNCRFSEARMYLDTT